MDSGPKSVNPVLNKFALKPVHSSDTNKSSRFGEKLCNEMDDNTAGLGSDRDSIVEFSKALELLISGQVKSAGGFQGGEPILLASHEPVSTNTQLSPSRLAGSSVKQLCDKAHLFRKSCLAYAENCLSPQQRFRLRELLTKLEKNADCLRSCSSSPNSHSGADHPQMDHLYNSLQSNIRDIISVVQK